MSHTEKKSKATKITTIVAAAVLGIFVAQSVMAVSEPPANGTCFRSKEICGLNGHNYSDHTYQGS